MEPLTIAIPKGRILQQLVPRFAQAGIDAAALLKPSRKLVREVAGWRFLLLKPDDVPTYVEVGAASLGVVGRDVLLERDYDVYVPLDLGLGRCRLMVAGPRGALFPPSRDRAIRVATKYPHVATRYFQSQGYEAEVIFVQGSVELAPITGLADLIVDIVETGETLRSNGLEELAVIEQVSSVLIANRASLKLEHARVQPLLAQLRGC